MTTFSSFLLSSFLGRQGERLLAAPVDGAADGGSGVKPSSTTALALSEGSPTQKVMLSVLRDIPFVDEVSDELGQPKEKETEDQFVQRGVKIFERHLRKALAAKSS